MLDFLVVRLKSYTHVLVPGIKRLKSYGYSMQTFSDRLPADSGNSITTENNISDQCLNRSHSINKRWVGFVVGVLLFWREISDTRCYSDGIYRSILSRVPWRAAFLQDPITAKACR